VAAGFEPAFELELALHPDDATRLPRLLARGGRGGRTSSVALTWHDSADGELAAAGLALLERRQGRTTRWRLERLCPEAAATWACGTPAPVLAEAPDRFGLGAALPDPLLVLARFHGRLRTLPETTAPTVTLLQGSLQSTHAAQPICRVTLAGEPPAVAGLALELAQQLRLSAPPASLSAAACAITGRALPIGPLGAPELPPGLSVGAACAFVCAHLGRVIQHYAPLAEAREDTEAVHQMRVAVRRLRSALALFRRAVACAEVAAAKADLGALGRALGPARDWDVFATGTGEAVAAAFPDDAAVLRLLAAAGRRRDACYDELARVLASPGFRRLGITLATLAAARPWERGADARQAGTLEVSLSEYAARALTRRLRHLTAYGDDISGLPGDTLHAIRLRAKRLRYGIEIFAPLYPRREVRRYTRRLAALQEWLGHLNDGSVAAALIAELGRAGGRGFAAGTVSGFVAAGARGARERIDRSWRKFRRLQPFWG
jgi:CHAD domain-containing protein